MWALGGAPTALRSLRQSLHVYGSERDNAVLARVECLEFPVEMRSAMQAVILSLADDAADSSVAKETRLLAACSAAVCALHRIRTVLLEAAAPLEAHSAYWHHISERRRAWGPVLSRAWDTWSGGPLEWVAICGAILRAQGKSLLASTSAQSHKSIPRTPASPLILESPAGKSAAIDELRDALMHVLGAVQRVLGAFVTLAPGATAAADAAAALQCATSLFSTLSGAPACAASTKTGDGGGAIEASHVNALSAESLDVLRSAVHEIPVALRSALSAHVAPLRRRSRAQESWWLWCLGLTGAAVLGHSAWRNRDALVDATRSARDGVARFYLEHVAEPLQGIVGELLGTSPSARVVEAADLADARRAAHAMLAELYTSQRMPVELLSPSVRADAAALPGGFATLAERMDTRALSDVIASSSVRPLRSMTTGVLGEALLVQTALLKRDVIEALAALEDVLAGQRMNMRVATALPAVVITYGVAAASARAVRAAVAVPTGAAAAVSASAADIIIAAQTVAHDVALASDVAAARHEGECGALAAGDDGVVVISYNGESAVAAEPTNAAQALLSVLRRSQPSSDAMATTTIASGTRSGGDALHASHESGATYDDRPDAQQSPAGSWKRAAPLANAPHYNHRPAPIRDVNFALLSLAARPNPAYLDAHPSARLGPTATQEESTPDAASGSPRRSTSSEQAGGGGPARHPRRQLPVVRGHLRRDAGGFASTPYADLDACSLGRLLFALWRAEAVVARLRTPPPGHKAVDASIASRITDSAEAMLRPGAQHAERAAISAAMLPLLLAAARATAAKG